jgi:DNA-binding MarR family transcriptional regulator
VAERLCVQHHTAVALVDRLEARGLITRERGTLDRREVLLRLTNAGAELLQELSALHREQLQTAGPERLAALQTIAAGRRRPRASVQALALND